MIPALLDGRRGVLEVHRIDEIVMMLEAYVLDGLDLSEQRVAAALRLLDLAIDDALPPNDGDEEEPVTADYRPVLAYSRDFAA